MTFTRLTLGEPRLRGRPKGGKVEQPCEEPVDYGVNILNDPGVENEPGGPDGDEIPYTQSGGGLFWPSNDEEITQTYSGQFTQIPGTAGTDYWEISTASPDAGTSHLHWPHSSAVRDLRLVQFVTCELYSTNYTAVSAWTETGDFVEMTVRAKSSVAATLRLRLHFIKQVAGHTSIAIIDQDHTTTTSYAAYSVDAVASEPGYLLAEIRPQGSDQWDLDTFTLEVQP